MLHDLPEELLERVAGFVPSVDWARASGACQRFSRVQPRRMDVIPRNMAAVRWYTKHWQRAEAVSLNLDMLDVGSSELCEVLDRGAESLWLTRIDELCIRGLADAFYDRPTWLEIMLTGAWRVQRLVLSAWSIDGLPALSHLRHLVLNIRDEFSSQVCSCIEGLKELETLSIVGGREWSPSSIPALDLSGCRSLRAAHFVYVAPEELIGAPEGSWIMLHRAAKLSLQRWASYGQICTAACMSILTLRSSTFSFPCPWLTFLKIETGGGGVGIMGGPLVISGAMPNLRVLDISCTQVSLRIEALLRLRRLSIDVQAITGLFIRDITLLTEQMVVLEVTGRPSTGTKSTLDDLLAAFRASSKSWRALEDVGWRHIDSVRKLLSQDEHPLACTCGGACLNCLKDAGLLQSFC